MEEVLVYAFEYLDAASQSWIRSPAYATMEAIAGMGARIVHGSVRKVARDAVASNGIAYQVPVNEKEQ